MKITNNELIKDLQMQNSTFYELKKRSPRTVELLKKGLLAEKMLNEKVLNEFIKQDNKGKR